MKRLLPLILLLPVMALTATLAGIDGPRNAAAFCTTPGMLDQSCIANALADKVAIQVPSGTYVFSSGVTVSANNVKINCDSGAILQAGTGVAMLVTLTGTNDSVEGCTLDGNGAGSTSNALLFLSNAVNPTLRGNTLKNTVPGQYGIRGDGIIGGVIAGNFVNTNIEGPGISLLTSGQNITISGNVVDNSASAITVPHGGATAFEFKTGGTGGNAIQNVTITGNTAVTRTGFCYEGGEWGTGGNPVQNVTVSNNSCTISNTAGTNGCGAAPAARACGGISISTASNVVVSGNTYNALGQRVDIAAIELVRCVGCAVTGNSLYSDTNSNMHPGISVNGTSRSTIMGNAIVGWGTNTESAGIKVSSNTANPNSDDNIISGNKLVFPVSSVASKAIYVSCNAIGGTTQRQMISGNHITGNAYGAGIAVANQGSCPADAYVSNNVIDNVPTGILYSSAALTVGFNQFTSTVANPLVNNGGGVIASIALTSPILNSVYAHNAAATVEAKFGAEAFTSGSGGIGTVTDHPFEIVVNNGTRAARFNPNGQHDIFGSLNIDERIGANGGITLPHATPANGSGVNLGNSTATSATAGSTGAIPSRVAGYWIININGTNYKVPYFSE